MMFKASFLKEPDRSAYGKLKMYCWWMPL